MLKALGLIITFFGLFNFEQYGLSISSFMQLLTGITLFFAETLITHLMFVQREKTRFYYRRRR
ncbi:hypothetical protein POAN111098_01755 [Polynucleobacter antarcticus]